VGKLRTVLPLDVGIRDSAVQWGGGGVPTSSVFQWLNAAWRRVSIDASLRPAPAPATALHVCLNSRVSYWLRLCVSPAWVVHPSGLCSSRPTCVMSICAHRPASIPVSAATNGQLPALTLGEACVAVHGWQTCEVRVQYKRTRINGHSQSNPFYMTDELDTTAGIGLAVDPAKISRVGFYFEAAPPLPVLVVAEQAH
jgi:hypothetical protein